MHVSVWLSLLAGSLIAGQRINCDQLRQQVGRAGGQQSPQIIVVSPDANRQANLPVYTAPQTMAVAPPGAPADPFGGPWGSFMPRGSGGSMFMLEQIEDAQRQAIERIQDQRSQFRQEKRDLSAKRYQLRMQESKLEEREEQLREKEQELKLEVQRSKAWINRKKNELDQRERDLQAKEKAFADKLAKDECEAKKKAAEAAAAAKAQKEKQPKEEEIEDNEEVVEE